MKQKVSSKLLILFGLICSIFFYAESGFCASVYSRDAGDDLASIEDKSSSFSAKLNESSSAGSDSSDSVLAEKIRAQRAALDVKDTQSAVAKQTKAGASSNSCDSNLRKCMTSKCGSEYEKCETDSDTIFSDKLNACKKDANCTAHEFNLFTNEIKADKAQSIRLSSYNKVISCGNAYNDCIIKECGPKFNKCLSKSAGDKALAKCKNIATECTEADSGLVGRIGNIFGIVRQDAEKQIKADEQKLYSLRKQMKDSCSMLGSGAMFDERSLDCVFTVNFFAGDDKKTPKASKKLYAGSTFNCSPDWFGIDVTTFKENAYRATRAQTAASSAMLGSGVGMAVGALTSGAISRAIDTKKAKDALEDACAEENMIIKDDKCFCDAGDKTGLVKQGDKCVCKDANKTYNKKSGKCENGTGETTDNNNDNNSNTDNTNTDNANTDNTNTDNTNNKNNNNTTTPQGKPCTPEQIGAAAGNLIGADKTEQRDGVCVPVSCRQPEYTLDNGKCVEAEEEEEQLCTPMELTALNAKTGLKDANGTCIPSSCAAYHILTDGKCVKDPSTSEAPAPTPAKVDNQNATAGINAAIEKENQKLVKACTDTGGDWNEKKGKCSCSKKKGLTDDAKGSTCKCASAGYIYDKSMLKCKKDNNSVHRQKCEETGGTFYDYANGGGCGCESAKLLQRVDKDGYHMCECDTTNGDGTSYYDPKDKRCYFTDQALKRCNNAGATSSDKAKGCICPPPYEEWQETGPMLTCLKPL